MAYFLEFDDFTVLPYLQALNLSSAGRERLLQMFADFADHPDQWIRDPAHRLNPYSDCFHVEFVFRDPGLDTLHVLRLIVSDAVAQFGILRVVYADSAAWPMSEFEEG